MQRGSRLKADKGTTETVGERDFLSPADIASSWGYHHQFILTIREKVQIRMHGFQRDDPQVRAPRSDGRHDIVAEPFLQRDPHVRECLEKPRKVVGKMRADRVVVREQGQEMLLSLYSRITLLRATSLMRIERLPASLRELDKLHKALKERNAEAAEVAARRHVEAAQEAAMQMLPATSE